MGSELRTHMCVYPSVQNIILTKNSQSDDARKGGSIVVCAAIKCLLVVRTAFSEKVFIVQEAGKEF